MGDLMVYKLYASATSSTDGAGSLDIAFDGMIQGYLADLSAIGGDALNERVGLEVSFASVSAFTTNDTRASIVGLDSAQQFLTTGGGPVGKAVAVSFGPDGIPVAAGERMYLHLLISGTITVIAHVWLYVRVTGMGRSDRRRV